MTGIGDEITPPDKENSKLKKLTDKLYSPNEYVGIKPRKNLTKQSFKSESSWNDGDLSSVLNDSPGKERRVNIFSILFFVTFLFFIGASGYGFFKFWKGGSFVVDSGVDLTITGPISIGGGEEFALDIILQNNSLSKIETVDLVVEYPEGTKQANDLKTDLPRTREGLGDVDSNGVIRKSVVSALFGEEGQSKQIKVRVEYRLPGSSAIFEESKVYDVVLQSSPIRMVIDSVTEITPNQELVFDVSITSNSNQQLDNVMFVAQYPFGFSFASSDVEAFDGKSKWLIGSLDPKETKKITIKGQLAGQDGENRVFKFSSGIADEKDKNNLGIVFTNISNTVTISQPFLALNMSIGGSANSVVTKEQRIDLESILTITNNTNSNIKDAEILLTFSGDVLDKSSVDSQDGFYRSGNNTLIWNKSVAPILSDMATGQKNSLGFNFRSLPLVSNASVFINPEIIINAKISALRFSETSVPEKIESTTFRKIRFQTQTSLQNTVEHVEGPLPPRVDQTTSYDITLKLKNSSNKVTNGVVTASLPVYVNWIGDQAGGSEKISYDKVSRLVKWNVGDLSVNTGYEKPSRDIKFRVSIEPSLSQISSSPILVKSIGFEGYDVFAEKTVNSSLGDISTRLSSSSYLDSEGIVVE